MRFVQVCCCFSQFWVQFYTTPEQGRGKNKSKRVLIASAVLANGVAHRGRKSSIASGSKSPLCAWPLYRRNPADMQRPVNSDFCSSKLCLGVDLMTSWLTLFLQEAVTGGGKVLWYRCIRTADLNWWLTSRYIPSLLAKLLDICAGKHKYWNKIFMPFFFICPWISSFISLALDCRSLSLPRLAAVRTVLHWGVSRLQMCAWSYGSQRQS